MSGPVGAGNLLDWLPNWVLTPLPPLLEGASDLVALLYEGDMLALDKLPEKLWKKYAKSDEEFSFTALLKVLKDKAEDWLISTVIKLVIKWLIKLAQPAAAILITIYDGVTWFIANAEKILNIIKSILSLLEKLVAKENGIQFVADTVVGLLKKALPTILGLIGGLLGIPDLGSVIRGWADALLDKAGDLLLKLFKKLLSLVGLGGTQQTGIAMACPTGCWGKGTRVQDEMGRLVPWTEYSLGESRAATIEAGDCDQKPAPEDRVGETSQYRIVDVRLEYGEDRYVELIFYTALTQPMSRSRVRKTGNRRGTMLATLPFRA